MMNKLRSLIEHEDDIYRRALAEVDRDRRKAKLSICIEKTIDLMLEVASGPVDDDDQKILSAMAARVFNSTAGALRQAMLGYHQTAWLLVRDLAEVGILASYFRHYPAELSVWRMASPAMRKKGFRLAALRTKIEQVEQEEGRVRHELYTLFSDHAAHLNPQSLMVLGLPNGSTRVGPVFDADRLGHCMSDIARHLYLAALPLVQCLAARNEAVLRRVEPGDLVELKKLAAQAGFLIPKAETSEDETTG